ncbi:MAG: TonB-dependent receptor [Cloacibacillus evryensis]
MSAHTPTPTHRYRCRKKKSPPTPKKKTSCFYHRHRHRHQAAGDEGRAEKPPELLKQVPGLHIIELKGRGAYTTASVRGSTASQVAVYVDGVLMNLGSEAAVDLSTIPVENVERIEVYRGYIPARFGGASMGGVINIITKNPDGKGEGLLSVGGGSYGKFRANASYSAKLGDGNIFVGFSRDQANGEFTYRNDNNTPYTPGDATTPNARTIPTRTPTPSSNGKTKTGRSKARGSATTACSPTARRATINRGARPAPPSSRTSGT